MDEPHTKLSAMVIGSVDTLRGTEMDQLIPAEWNCDPPFLLKVHRPRQKDKPSQDEHDSLLKAMLRLGVPPALRCAVWLSNIIQAVHPQQAPSYWLEYRTLSKIRALENAYECILKQVLYVEQDVHGNDDKQNKGVDDVPEPPNDDAWEALEAPNYGRADNAATIDGIVPAGSLACKRVLIALERILGMDFSPLLPALASIFLTCMSEAYSFCAIREMSHQSACWYFPVSSREHNAWCCAFGDILRKLHPATAEYLEDRGVLDVAGLAPIFQDFWIGVLPLKYIQRIMDLYTLEGSKVLFRFGVSLLVLYKIESAEMLLTISRADEWWNTMKNWAYSKRFDFDLVVRKAYGVHGRGIRRQMRFPRRSIIQRIIRLEEDNIRRSGEENDIDEEQIHPLGLVVRTHDEEGNALVQPILAESHSTRLLLAKWLPVTLRLNNLNLLYSTNSHGRTLERFYSHVKNSKHTVLICEVLHASNETPVVLGMYAPQAWRVSPKVYGDGGVFLFRLQPNPTCWKWHPVRPKVGGKFLDQVDLEDDSSNNMTALLEQFMVGTNQFISMGGNPDGSCGLRINEDLTRGESSPATGFDNEPLHGLNNGSVFEIGLLEVYGFVRQIDGKAV